MKHPLASANKIFTLLFLTAILYTNAFAQASIKGQFIAGGSGADRLGKMCLTKYGGLLLAGYSSSNHSFYKTEDSRGDYDYWVIKYSATQDGRRKKQWDKTIGGDTSDVLVTALYTRDGGYILAGNSNSGESGEKTQSSFGGLDYWLVKLDGKGNIQWDKTIGGSYDDFLTDVDQTRDGGYILSGTLGLTKIDKLGNVEWQKLRGLYPGSVRQTKDGGYIITGSDSLIKADSAGNTQWSKALISAAWVYYTQQTSDGGFITYGYGAYSYSESGGYYYDFFNDILKTDSLGNEQWRTAPKGYISYPTLLQTNDGYILALGGGGTRYGAYYVEKLNKEGASQWYQYFDGNGADNLKDIKKTGRNRYLLGGYSNSGISGDKTVKNLGNFDYWIVNIVDTTEKNITTNSIVRASAIKKETKDISVYPNPVEDILHVQTAGKATLTLTDQSGKILLTKIINGKGEINIANLAAGLYYLKNTSTGVVQKVIVNK